MESKEHQDVPPTFMKGEDKSCQETYSNITGATERSDKFLITLCVRQQAVVFFTYLCDGVGKKIYKHKITPNHVAQYVLV